MDHPHTTKKIKLFLSGKRNYKYRREKKKIFNKNTESSSEGKLFKMENIQENIQFKYKIFN